ncbi:MAG: glycosyltransferase [Vicinamibacterales bacterium]
MIDSAHTLPGDVAVAIVSHNGRQTLPRVLECLVEAGVPDDRVTVYDIASTDDTAAWLAREHRAIVVVRLSANAGPNPARNRALREARLPYLLLLDSDAYVRPDAIAALREELTGISIAAVVPVVVHEQQPDRIQYAGASLHFICEAINPWLGRPLAERGDEARGVDTAPGVCFLLRVSTALEIGGFDDRYFMGKEDGEFCYRLRVAGYRLVETPKAVVAHASRPRSTWLYRYQLRNRWHFMLKNYQLRTLVVVSPALVVHEPLQLAALIAQGHAVAWVQAVAGLLPMLKHLGADRRAVGRTRRVHDRVLLHAAPLVVRAEVVGGRTGQRAKHLYDRWLAWYWRLASALLS